MVVACLLGATLLAPLTSWEFAGPLLLFFGLLTLVNAPFDWLSIGLTRALLRRGLERGGWWPLFYALIDAALAAVIIAALTVAMVVFVQAFDDLAALAAGDNAKILPLDRLFSGIAAHPEAPEYWWAYALLLSTMIPSLANLMIGGASLVRGVPGFPAMPLRYMPDVHGGKVLEWDRVWIAIVLTLQNALGILLGFIAQTAIAVALIFCVMPWLGFDLLDLAQGTADLKLPQRLIRCSGKLQRSRTARVVWLNSVWWTRSGEAHIGLKGRAR